MIFDTTNEDRTEVWQAAIDETRLAEIGQKPLPPKLDDWEITCTPSSNGWTLNREEFNPWNDVDLHRYSPGNADERKPEHMIRILGALHIPAVYINYTGKGTRSGMDISGYSGILDKPYNGAAINVIHTLAEWVRAHRSETMQPRLSITDMLNSNGITTSAEESEDLVRLGQHIHPLEYQSKNGASKRKLLLKMITRTHPDLVPGNEGLCKILTQLLDKLDED